MSSKNKPTFENKIILYAMSVEVEIMNTSFLYVIIVILMVAIYIATQL